MASCPNTITPLASWPIATTPVAPCPIAITPVGTWPIAMTPVAPGRPRTIARQRIRSATMDGDLGTHVASWADADDVDHGSLWGIGSATAVARRARRLGRGGQLPLERCSRRGAGGRASTTDTGRRALAVGADVAIEEEAIALFDAASTGWVRLHCLVNNAGIGPGYGPFVDLTVADIEATWATNLTGAFVCAREAVRRMAASQRWRRRVDRQRVVVRRGDRQPVRVDPLCGVEGRPRHAHHGPVEGGRRSRASASTPCGRG